MTKSKKGFTIIEVVLVLAIAGLIFLMVFIALPALQRSQRNTRRRSDMARLLSAFTEYQSNVGKMPSSSSDLNTFVDKYVNGTGSQGGFNTSTCTGDQFCDPDGSPYRFYNTSSYKLGASHFSPSVGQDVDYKGSAASSVNETAITHTIWYWTSAKCGNDEGKMTLTSGSNEIAIAYYLEGGAIYCGDNQ